MPGGVGEEKGIPRVRVRGIYATALTGIMLEEGFQVVQASRVISERMGIPQLSLPADVTVKNNDRDPGEILVIGYGWAVRSVVEALKKRLPFSLYLYSLLPAHATVVAEIKGVSNGRCLGVVGDVEVVVEGLGQDECRTGERIVGYVARTALRRGELPVVRRGVKVLGDYAMMYRGARVSVTLSEHIRNPERKALLLSLASDYAGQGVSVHWRSSANIGSRDDLVRELRELYARLRELEEKLAGEERTGVYSVGEDVSLVALSGLDKEVLDSIRARYTPTAPLHHSLKSLEPDKYSVVVDFADTLAGNGVGNDALRRGFYAFIAEEIRKKGRIRIIHEKLDGRIIRLGEPFVASIELTGSGLEALLRRTVRSYGVYDGLGVDKEPGDVIETVVKSDEWTIIHRYYGAGGGLKGVYININTPPEFSPTTIRYVDLEVDIVKLPGQKPRLIDLEELRDAYTSGRVTREMVEKIAEVVSREGAELGETIRSIL